MHWRARPSLASSVVPGASSLNQKVPPPHARGGGRLFRGRREAQEEEAGAKDQLPLAHPQGFEAGPRREAQEEVAGAQDELPLALAHPQGFGAGLR